MVSMWAAFVVAVVDLLLGFLVGWSSARHKYVHIWLDDREAEALRRQRVLHDAHRKYPARNDRPVRIHQAKITDGRE